MNGSEECDSLIDNVNWTDANSIVILVVLLLINLMVVFGNCLVIAAVFISSKLRTVTNLFIVSLATADLMVGVAVLPFSATWEVFKVWIFGDLWCSMWLAVDVWMCTASILNLCAISLDRYVAVTRPVNYPSIMSSSRAKLLIAGVWILSFVICFPPLVGWKDSSPANGTFDPPSSFRIRHPHPLVINQRPSPVAATTTTPAPPKNFTDLANSTDHAYLEYDDYPAATRRRVKKSPANDILKRLASFSGVPVIAINHFRYPGQDNLLTEASGLSLTTPRPFSDTFGCPWICELTSDTGYVIYSALGSFFIPMGVMLFFYWRIYRAAVQTTRAINQGFRTTKGSGGFGNRFDEQRLTLRIHRGRGSVQNHSSSASSSVTTCGSPSANSTFGKSPETQRLSRARSTKSGRTHEKIKISVSYPSSDQISSSALNNNGIPPPSSPGLSPRTPNEPLIGSSVDGKNYLSIGGFHSPKKTIFFASPPRRNFFQNHFSYAGPKEVAYSVHYSNKNGKETTTSNVYKSREPNCHLRVTGTRLTSKQERSSSIDSTTSGCEEDSFGASAASAAASRRSSTRSQMDDAVRDLSPSLTFDDASPQKPKLVSKMGKRNIKTQVKRFRMETKAAKTLGIIVGGFILCWMPFFTIYLVRAFCPDCINPVVFSVLFWLGYCNSAINPCIYALFSKDFRFAFKKIICRFLCGPEKRLSINLKRRGSDGSQVKVHGRQRSSSYNPPNSVGEDSDPGASDSR